MGGVTEVCVHGPCQPSSHHAPFPLHTPQTASLIAASCRSSAVFSGMSEEVKEAMYAYGKHLGLAFQVRHQPGSGSLAGW